MPEYGPFIEYCCELYIHHDVVNAIVGVAIVFCPFCWLSVRLF